MQGFNSVFALLPPEVRFNRDRAPAPSALLPFKDRLAELSTQINGSPRLGRTRACAPSPLLMSAAVLTPSPFPKLRGFNGVFTLGAQKYALIEIEHLHRAPCFPLRIALRSSARRSTARPDSDAPELEHRAPYSGAQLHSPPTCFQTMRGFNGVFALSSSEVRFNEDRAPAVDQAAVYFTKALKGLFAHLPPKRGYTEKQSVGRQLSLTVMKGAYKCPK